MLSDLELRTAFRAAEDMWQLVERFQEENGGGPDVQRVRDAAPPAAPTILRALPELGDGAAPSDEVVAAAKQWLPANSAA